MDNSPRSDPFPFSVQDTTPAPLPRISSLCRDGKGPSIARRHEDHHQRQPPALAASLGCTQCSGADGAPGRAVGLLNWGNESACGLAEPLGLKVVPRPSPLRERISAQACPTPPTRRRQDLGSARPRWDTRSRQTCKGRDVTSSGLFPVLVVIPAPRTGCARRCTNTEQKGRL